jgi:hypothetical protein
MRETEASEVAVLLGKLPKLIDYGRDAPRQQRETFANQDQISIVGDITARRAQMDDRPGRRAGVAIGMHVGHHVVPQLRFVSGGTLEVDVVHMGLQLLKLLLRDEQPKLALGFGQHDPQPPP